MAQTFNTPKEPTLPKAHDIPTRRLLDPWRRRYFAAFIMTTALVTVAAISLGALTTTDSNWSPVGVIVVIAEVLLFLAGFVWLALLATSRREPRANEGDSSTPRDP